MPATQGCKCRECFGLAEAMLEITGKDYDLPRASGCGASKATLHVLTFDPERDPRSVEIPLAVVCDGSMTCSCNDCSADRKARVRRGVRPSQPIPFKRAA